MDANHYVHACEETVDVRASSDVLFDYLDDQTRLAAHMGKPSMMMLGGRMTYEFDEAKGRAVRSVIRMSGSFLGLHLFVEEVVNEQHDPPRRKVWAIRGRPRIFIIGAYRMGFEIAPIGEASRLRVFIEYDVPASLVGRILGRLFAPMYARWCVRRMADDARRQFQS